MDSYFSLLNRSFIENYHIIIFTAFAKQSMINQLSNPINRNRSAAKISKVMSSIVLAFSPSNMLLNTALFYAPRPFFGQNLKIKFYFFLKDPLRREERVK